MPETNLTPEEKLLRIIESPHPVGQGMRPRRRVQDFKAVFQSFKARYTGTLKELLTLKTAKIVLVIAAAMMTFFLALDFWAGSPRMSTLEHLEATAKKLDIGEIAIKRLDPLSIYEQEITQRNIFALPAPVQEDKSKPAVPAVSIASLTNGLKVVGIIWSQAPQAIIEDAKDGRTYLLNRGGKIKDARVKEILKESVILSYDNQEIELK